MIVSAPGRVNLIGEHTDYNGGAVLPMAIDLRTSIAVRKEPRARVSTIVSSADLPEVTFDITRPARAGDWGDYVRGVVVAMTEQGRALDQISLAIDSNVPVGAGLSSSAALEVAMALALAKLFDIDAEPRELAMAAWRAETEFVGVPVGVMDQFASALAEEGSALHIRCDTLETRTVPFANAVLVFDTAVPRSLRSSQFEVRRAECERALSLLREKDPGLAHLAHATPDQVARAQLPAPLDRRAMHVVRETRRVTESVEELVRTGRIPGDSINDSHASLRDLYECSSPQLDWFHASANQLEGVIGARLTGAGWGGCAIAIGDAAALEDAAPKLAAEYQRAFGLTARSWLTRAAAGAMVE